VVFFPENLGSPNRLRGYVCEFCKLPVGDKKWGAGAPSLLVLKLTEAKAHEYGKVRGGWIKAHGARWEFYEMHVGACLVLGIEGARGAADAERSESEETHLIFSALGVLWAGGEKFVVFAGLKLEINPAEGICPL